MRNIEKGQFSCRPSAVKDRNAPTSNFLDIAHRYLKEMGLCQRRDSLCLFYAHHDTDNNHIHIITSRVAPDGLQKSIMIMRSDVAGLLLSGSWRSILDSSRALIFQRLFNDALCYRYTSKVSVSVPSSKVRDAIAKMMMDKGSRFTSIENGEESGNHPRLSLSCSML
jgi:hypothetical protein